MAAVGDQGVAHHLVVELAPAGSCRTDRRDHRTRLEPGAAQDRLGGIGDGTHDVGAAHCLLCARAGDAANLCGAALHIAGIAAPDPNLADRPDRAQCHRMGAGERAAAQQREHFRCRRGQRIAGDRGHRSGAQLSNPGAVHDRQGATGARIHQDNGGQQGRQAELRIAGKLRDQFGDQRLVAHHRFDEKQAAGIRNLHHHALRLDHATGRQIDEGVAQCRHQGGQAEQATHRDIVEVQGRRESRDEQQR